jgi:hypothetical protein
VINLERRTAALLGFSSLGLITSWQRVSLETSSSFRLGVPVRSGKPPVGEHPPGSQACSLEPTHPSEVCHLLSSSRVFAASTSLGHPSGAVWCYHLAAPLLRNASAAAGAPRDHCFGDGSLRNNPPGYCYSGQPSRFSFLAVPYPRGRDLSARSLSVPSAWGLGWSGMSTEADLALPATAFRPPAFVRITFRLCFLWAPPLCPVPCGDPGGSGRTSALPPPFGLSADRLSFPDYRLSADVQKMLPCPFLRMCYDPVSGMSVIPCSGIASVAVLADGAPF